MIASSIERTTVLIDTVTIHAETVWGDVEITLPATKRERVTVEITRVTLESVVVRGHQAEVLFHSISRQAQGLRHVVHLDPSTGLPIGQGCDCEAARRAHYRRKHCVHVGAAQAVWSAHNRLARAIQVTAWTRYEEAGQAPVALEARWRRLLRTTQGDRLQAAQLLDAGVH